MTIVKNRPFQQSAIATAEAVKSDTTQVYHTKLIFRVTVDVYISKQLTQKKIQHKNYEPIFLITLNAMNDVTQG